MSEPPRLLAGMLPYGDRTFLPRGEGQDGRAAGLGLRELRCDLGYGRDVRRKPRGPVIGHAGRTGARVDADFRVKVKGLPDYKPVSVPRFLKAGRQPFVLAGNLFPARATYPEVVTERAAPAPLFGLAPHGVCPASDRYRRRGALLPHLFTLTRRKYTTGGIVFCGTFRKTRFKRALPAVSRHAALWRPDFPPARPGCPVGAGGYPSGRPDSIIKTLGPGGQLLYRIIPKLPKHMKELMALQGSSCIL